MHPEANALLDAIFDHPDEDTPRLIYADWLQEHGHEDCAQFIWLSLKADRGYRTQEERKQIRAERLPHWQRMTAFLPPDKQPFVQIHHFKRGSPRRVDVPADTFIQTVPNWWPVLTPVELAVYAINGHEDEVASLVGRYLPNLRKLECDTRVVKEDHDLDRNEPIRGDFIAKLLLASSFPKLEALVVQIAWANAAALTSLMDSELVLRLQSLFLEVRFPQTDQYAFVGDTQQKMRPDAIRHEIASFLNRHRDRLITSG